MVEIVGRPRIFRQKNGNIYGELRELWSRLSVTYVVHRKNPLFYSQIGRADRFRHGSARFLAELTLDEPVPGATRLFDRSGEVQPADEYRT